MMGLGRRFGVRVEDRPAKSPEVVFGSTKTFTHSIGLSCAFRQWRAMSHCNKLHGYAIQVKMTFEGPLNETNWVMDFGGLKNVKKWLEDTLDHKTLVAKDDPLMHLFLQAQDHQLLDLVVVEHTGMERLAEMILRKVSDMMVPPIRLMRVDVNEHEANSAYCQWRT